MNYKILFSGFFTALIIFITGFLVGVDTGKDRERNLIELEQIKCNCCHSPMAREILKQGRKGIKK